MDPGPILYTEIQSTAILVLLFSANNHLPHNTVNPLLQQAGEIDNLTVKLGQSILVVVCAGSTLLLTPVVRPATSQLATPSEVMPFSY